jgi:hypothetical protein
LPGLRSINLSSLSSRAKQGICFLQKKGERGCGGGFS